MADGSGIEWTDATWNPTRGCEPVSEGCRNCYAMKQAHRFSAPGRPFAGLTRLTLQGPRWTGEVRTVPELLDLPLKWREPRRIFVDSMSDLFHPDVPEEFIAQVWLTMHAASRHTFQILTKRPARMREVVPRLPALMEAQRRQAATEKYGPSETRSFAPILWPLPNVWLGTSVEHQRAADERIPHLLGTPAAVRFLSCEPLLGPVDIAKWLRPRWGEARHVEGHGLLHPMEAERVDWVIVGGESGPGARPMHIAWARSLRDQCQDAGVAFFFKQHGDWVDPADVPFPAGTPFSIKTGVDWVNPDGTRGSGPKHHPDAAMVFRIGKKAAGRVLDGRTWDDVPTPAVVA